MKSQVTIFVSIILLSVIMLVPTAVASSAFVISEEEARSYQYSVEKQQDTYLWTIGFEDKESILVEDQSNTNNLNAFRIAVGEIDINQTSLIISVVYLLFIASLTLFLFLKNKQVLKKSIIFIVIFSGIGLYDTVENVLDLQRALKVANYYYVLLTGEGS
ncbi:putative PurR-regulated permease PerM [Alkalihalobacillus xiaoxiensis]|uniref:PurR-regulated permease PerM n=1 Tax=Shouchella xiaoxiensis TaxID=766895 RepID=A0ABS2SN62_9BACI|nr:hypothetical protein [Shouchella xiaoxiensis]MBM7836962.1 putative PurR-regulated permease PerM [Shouchella xiaoxiensis]